MWVWSRCRWCSAQDGRPRCGCREVQRSGGYVWCWCVGSAHCSRGLAAGHCCRLAADHAGACADSADAKQERDTMPRLRLLRWCVVCHIIWWIVHYMIHYMAYYILHGIWYILQPGFLEGQCNVYCTTLCRPLYCVMQNTVVFWSGTPITYSTLSVWTWYSACYWISWLLPNMEDRHCIADRVAHTREYT